MSGFEKKVCRGTACKGLRIGSGAIHRDGRGAAFPQSRDCLVWQIAALHIRDRKRSVAAERSDRFTPPMLD